MERLDRFMARANQAYYATHDPFADFTTSPEISQVFGELIGLWAAVVWESMGRPDPVLLAEAGPGRGTLMADALRAIGQTTPAFGAALRLHLIETSPRLRALQAAALPGAVGHAQAADLPDGKLLLIANEFLDALPVRQFVRCAKGWTERFVEAGAFLELPCGSSPLPRPLPRRGGEGKKIGADRELPLPRLAGEDAAGEGSAGEASGIARGGQSEGERERADGTVVEICEPALELAALLGQRLAAQGGAALFIDYGPERSAAGDSLQALRDRRPAEPLADPGRADLTAHVDFESFAEAARSAGAAVHGPVPQGLFLARLGLFRRTERLARGQPPARAASLLAAARRLAEPMHMGRLFKVLALTAPGVPTPPGFETDA